MIAGRPADSPDNTTKVPMPPRGGRDDLTDEDLRDIRARLRFHPKKLELSELRAEQAATGQIAKAASHIPAATRPKALIVRSPKASFPAVGR